MMHICKFGEMVVLLKPQFECGEKNLTKGGIVKSKKVLKTIIVDFFTLFSELNLFVKGVTTAPIRDNKNIEFLFYLSKQFTSIEIDINNLIDGLT